MKAVITNISVSAAATIMLYLAYFLGSAVASSLGCTQRGGVSWGISVFYSSLFMFPIAAFSWYLFKKLNYHSAYIALIGFLLFVTVSSIFLGDQFLGFGWKHPIRYLYFQVCAFFTFIVLVVVNLAVNKGHQQDGKHARPLRDSNGNKDVNIK